MEWELALHPDDADNLSRSKLIGAVKGARLRHHVARMVWHDSPDRALRAAGLIVVEQRGDWRLERLIPGDRGWLPGQPAPVLAHGATSVLLAHGATSVLLAHGAKAAALADQMPDQIVPVAAFDGRMTTIAALAGDIPVTLRLLRGDLRGVMTTVPVCRLLFDGPDEAVRSLALSLTEVFRLTVPRASLAAEALAAAEGWVPPPRGLGAPDPVTSLTVATAFAAIIGHLTDVILHYAPLAEREGRLTEPVHQMRVAVRRARSVIAVFGHAMQAPVVSEAGRELKALGAVLGPARDRDVFVTETLPPIIAAFPADERLGRLLVAAEKARAEAHAALDQWLIGASFRRMAVSLAWLAASSDWHAALEPERHALAAMPVPEFAAIVLRRRWKQLLAAGKGIEDLPVPALHGLRLRVKRTRYAAEVFTPGQHAKPALRLLRRLSVLQQRLGLLNDGAVAETLLHQLGGPAGRHGYAVGLILGYIGAGAAGARPGIVAAWDKISKTPPFWA